MEMIIETIKSTIRDYGNGNQAHTLWKDPLIEVISADDEGLKILKEAVSPDHRMPRDILPDAKSIISFFIPYGENVVQSNVEGEMASEEWVTAHIKTNDLIKAINDAIETLMERNGRKAGKIPATYNFDEEKLISNWSHRHIAYIAGLGTFGMNNMLITKEGCCGRFGSIIINYGLKEYKQNGEPKEKCLHKRNGTCGICRGKCIINAYRQDGYDRHKCYGQCLKNLAYQKSIGSREHADVCGKCLVGLPCSLKEP